MSSTKKDRKGARRFPQRGDKDGIEEVRFLKDFPHVPVPLLQALDRHFSHEGPQETGAQLRMLFRMAMFPTGEDLIRGDLDELAPLWELMELFLDAPLSMHQFTHN